MHNDYSKKTDAELDFIIKDASEAARNMRGFDFAAECKYMDQINDACTERMRRMTKKINKAPKWKRLERLECDASRFGRIAEAMDELKFMFPNARIVVRTNKDKHITSISAYEEF